MTLRNIFIVRHGYRADWLPYYVAHPTGFDCDPPLAPHGVDQARELADFFQTHTPHQPQAVFSSPYYRCVETANPTAERLNIPIFLERGIGEWFKPLRGPIPEPPRVADLQPFFKNLSADWRWDTVVPSPAGEDECGIFRRCQQFWTLFVPKFEQQFPDIDSVLLVSHAATKIALGMALLGYNSPQEYIRPVHGGNGETSRIDASTCSLDSYLLRDGKWAVDFTGNTDYLTSGSEMGWHFATSRFVAGSKEDIEARKAGGSV